MYFGINRRRNFGPSRGAIKKKTPEYLSRRYGKLFKQSQLVLFFMPGLFFAAVGICALVAPRFLMAAIAGFFLFLGLAFSILAWKFVQLKKRFEKVARNFEARVYLQGISSGYLLDDEAGSEPKKVIFH